MKERFEVITFRYFRTIYEIRKSSGYISSSDGTDGPRVDGSREWNEINRKKKITEPDIIERCILATGGVGLHQKCD